MLVKERGIGFGLVIAVLSVLSAKASAQTVFTYSATDYKSVVMVNAGSNSIAVGTVVIVHGSPVAPTAQGPTKIYELSLRPPAAESPKLLLATVDNVTVSLSISGSTIDGELQAAVEIPVSAGDSPEVKIYWSTKDAGTMITGAKPTQAEESRPALSTNVNRGHVRSAGPLLLRVATVLHRNSL